MTLNSLRIYELAKNGTLVGNSVSAPTTRLQPWLTRAGQPQFPAILAILTASLAVLAGGCGEKPAQRVPPPITVSTTNATQGNINVTVPRIGTVTPVYTVSISPRVDGQIVSVNYTEGQMVKSNDLLLEIDPGPYQAQLTQAEGQLARDQAQLKGALIDLDRFKTAYEKNAIPKQQYDDQEALVEQDQGTVKFDQGQVASAKVQLAYCSVRAPINGRVGLRLVDPGNVVHAANSNALVVIAQLQPITVVFSDPEDYLPQIQEQLKAGHTMPVQIFDRTQEKHLATGTFLTMDNMVDVSTGTVRIKALFKNEDLTLFPNQFVNTVLIINTLSNVTLIPTSAIQRNPQGAFVYVVGSDDAVKMQSITPGVVDGNITSVEGLQPGATIATDNFNKLGDGVKVTLRQAGQNGGRGGRRGGQKPSTNSEPRRGSPE